MAITKFQVLRLRFGSFYCIKRPKDLIRFWSDFQAFTVFSFLKKKSTQAMEILQLFTLTAHPIDTLKVMV
jgi:hypothetical protein